MQRIFPLKKKELVGDAKGYGHGTRSGKVGVSLKICSG
jgi:hypothetical protein